MNWLASDSCSSGLPRRTKQSKSRSIKRRAQCERLIEARKIIYELLQDMRDAGRPAAINGIDFVECEDSGETIMIYCDVDDEQDAICIWFDRPGEVFEPQRYRREFFKRALVVS
jgi:hypothetical protein